MQIGPKGGRPGCEAQPGASWLAGLWDEQPENNLSVELIGRLMPAAVVSTRVVGANDSGIVCRPRVRACAHKTLRVGSF